MDHAQRLVYRYEIERTKFLPDCVEHQRHVSNRDLGVRRQTKIERWKRTKKLGRGTFGEVWLEEEKEGRLRAVKIIDKDEKTSTDMMRLRELFAMANMAENQACFLGFEGWFQNDDQLFIAMEYCELGDLRKYMKNCTVGYLAEEEVRTIVFQLAECIDYMHKENIVHRDLKPENILVVCGAPRWWIKLTDFGVSKWVHEGTSLHTTYYGPFVAPEVSMLGSHNSSSYSNAVDMWSLGCVAHWLSTARTPFEGGTRLNDYYLYEKPFPLEALQERELSAACMDLISTLMAKVPTDRMTARQTLGSSWLQHEPYDGTLLGTDLQSPLSSKANQHDLKGNSIEELDGAKPTSAIDTQTTHESQATVTVPYNLNFHSGETIKPENTGDSRHTTYSSMRERVHKLSTEAVHVTQLIPWVPAVHVAWVSWDQSEVDQYVPGSWDQFDANERLFGITGSFDDILNEEIYTTVLDRTSSTYKSREAEAERIEREILGTEMHEEALDNSVNRDSRSVESEIEGLRISELDYKNSSATIDKLPSEGSQPQLSKVQKKRARAKRIPDLMESEIEGLRISELDYKNSSATIDKLPSEGSQPQLSKVQKKRARAKRIPDLMESEIENI